MALQKQRVVSRSHYKQKAQTVIHIRKPVAHRSPCVGPSGGGPVPSRPPGPRDRSIEARRAEPLRIGVRARRRSSGQHTPPCGHTAAAITRQQPARRPVKNRPFHHSLSAQSAWCIHNRQTMGQDATSHRLASSRLAGVIRRASAGVRQRRSGCRHRLNQAAPAQPLHVEYVHAARDCQATERPRVQAPGPPAPARPLAGWALDPQGPARGCPGLATRQTS